MQRVRDPQGAARRPQQQQQQQQYHRRRHDDGQRNLKRQARDRDDNDRRKRRRAARSRSSRRSRSLPSRSASRSHNVYWQRHSGTRHQPQQRQQQPHIHPENYRTHQNHDRDYQQQQQQQQQQRWPPANQYHPHNHSYHGSDRQQRQPPQRQRHQRRSSTPSSSTVASSRSRRQRYPAPVPVPQRSSKAWLVSDDDDAAFHMASGALANNNNHPNRQQTYNNKTNGRQVVERTLASSSVQDDLDGHFLGERGTVIADTYRIERELGEGTFGRVFECLDVTTTNARRDSRQDGGNNNSTGRRRVVAIKVVRKVKRYYDSALIEASIVSDVNRRGGRGTTHFAVMFDAFNHIGHFCLVFESLGKSLYDYLKRNKYQPFPMHYVRDFSQQILEAVEFIHSFRLIHTDLKPENILLINCREISRGSLVLPESTHIKIIDFGGATYDDEKKSSVVNTRQYRAPEVILGCGWSMPSDLWSAGCILTELYQGELLFPTHDNTEHLAMIEKIIRPFPRRMLREASHFSHQLVKEAFTSRGRHRLDKVLPPESAIFVQNLRPLESIVHPNHEWFLNLLRGILVIEPQYRASARQALQYFG